MQKRKSFTLIELLVVIAIIAILAAMLLPALNRARGMAQRTKCAGQIGQTAMALINYASDFNDWAPGGHPLQEIPGFCFRIVLGQETRPWWPAGLYGLNYLPAKYAFDEPFWQCPTRQYTDNFGFCLNGSLSGVPQFDAVNNYFKTGLVRQPSQVAWVYEGTDADGVFYPRHHNTFNASFVDGHSANIPLSELSGIAPDSYIDRGIRYPIGFPSKYPFKADY